MGFASSSTVVRGHPEVMEELWDLAAIEHDYENFHDRLKKIEDQALKTGGGRIIEDGVKYDTSDQLWDIVCEFPLLDVDFDKECELPFNFCCNATKCKHRKRVLDGRVKIETDAESADRDAKENLRLPEPGVMRGEAQLSLPTRFGDGESTDWVYIKEPASVLLLLHGESYLGSLKASLDRDLDHAIEHLKREEPQDILGRRPPQPVNTRKTVAEEELALAREKIVNLKRHISRACQKKLPRLLQQLEQLVEHMELAWEEANKNEHSFRGPDHDAAAKLPYYAQLSEANKGRLANEAATSWDPRVTQWLYPNARCTSTAATCSHLLQRSSYPRRASGSQRSWESRRLAYQFAAYHLHQGVTGFREWAGALGCLGLPEAAEAEQRSAAANLKQILQEAAELGQHLVVMHKVI